MPRKRKKSTLQRKPSLVFTESPVHVQKNVPSPVFCARHPTTAETVQVTDLHNRLPWVSPQFRGISSSSSLPTRRRRKSIACLRNINKENLCDGHTELKRNGNNKYRSLKFLGDPRSVVSVLSDIDITIDSDTASENEHSKKTDTEIGNSDSPGDSWGNKRKRVKQKRKPNKFQENLEKINERLNSCDTLNREVSKKISANQECVDVGPLDIHGECEHENLDESSKIEFTQLLRKPKSVAPVKRLFSTQLACCSDAKMDCSVSIPDDRLICSETEPETISNSESESGVDTTPNVRRSLRLHMLQTMLLATPANSMPCKVLAPDTPEDEYGWTLRKRQLKNYKNR